MIQGVIMLSYKHITQQNGKAQKQEKKKNLGKIDLRTPRQTRFYSLGV